MTTKAIFSNFNLATLWWKQEPQSRMLGIAKDLGCLTQPKDDSKTENYLIQRKENRNQSCFILNKLDQFF
jgi:hypothetical protein